MKVYYPEQGEYPEEGTTVLCKVQATKTTIVKKFWKTEWTDEKIGYLWIQCVWHSGKWRSPHSASADVIKWCYMTDLLPEVMW